MELALLTTLIAKQFKHLCEIDPHARFISMFLPHYTLTTKSHSKL